MRYVIFPLHLSKLLRATTACNFSSLICPAGSAPAALASLLFDPPEPQIIGKTHRFATFLPFRAPGSSFFETFSAFWTWQHQKRSNSARLPDYLIFWIWQRQKWNNSASLPQFSKLTTSKTKQFCETSFKNGIQKWKVECRADGLVPMHVAICTFHLFLSLM